MTEKTTVVIAVTGKLDNGEIFYTIPQEKPMSIALGNSDLPPTLEAVISTMTPGESRKVRVPPEEGYGARQKDLLQTIDNQEMVDRIHPVPGMILSLKVEREGEVQPIPATVMEVNGSVITVDYNHPLAGHHLNYEVTLLDKK